MRFITKMLLISMLTSVPNVMLALGRNEPKSCIAPARAKCPSVGNCDDVIRTCDKAINGLKAEVSKQKEILGLQDKRSAEQGAEIERLRSRADSLINSKWFWFSIGLVGGVAALHYVSK